MTTDAVLVVDLGAATTSAALVADGSVRLLRESASDSWSWPSAVCFGEEGMLVGTSAVNLGKANPDACRVAVKRDLGGRPVVLSGRRFRPEELVAELLRALRARAVQVLGSAPLDRLVLISPTEYTAGDPRIKALVTAGELAGFGEVDVLDEAVAAASTKYDGVGLAPGSLVLVHDIGTGVNTTLLRLREDGAHEIIAHERLDDCGGDQIDELLLQRLRLELGDTDRLTAELIEFARQLKHQTATSTSAQDFFLPLNKHVGVDRSELMALTEPLLDVMYESCAQVLRAGVTRASPLSAVLVVGGGHRLPWIAEQLGILKVPVLTTPDPATAVVLGAARSVASGERRGGAPLPVDSDVAMSWSLPGGAATVARLAVPAGHRYEPRELLLVARLPQGGLRYLQAGDQPGTLLAWHVAPGDTIVSDQWLATSGPPTPGGERVTEPISEPGSGGGTGSARRKRALAVVSAAAAVAAVVVPIVVASNAFSNHGPGDSGSSSSSSSDSSSYSSSSSESGSLSYSSDSSYPSYPSFSSTTSRSSYSSPVPTSSLSLSSGQRSLYDKLSGEGVDWKRCAGFGNAGSTVDAAITCNTTDPTLAYDVVFATFATLSDYNAFFSTAANQVGTNGDCSTGQEHTGTWHKGSSGPNIGQFVCYKVSSNLRVLWGNSDKLIAAYVQGSGVTPYTWWYKHAPVLAI